MQFRFYIQLNILAITLFIVGCTSNPTVNQVPEASIHTRGQQSKYASFSDLSTKVELPVEAQKVIKEMEIVTDEYAKLSIDYSHFHQKSASPENTLSKAQIKSMDWWYKARTDSIDRKIKNLFQEKFSIEKNLKSDVKHSFHVAFSNLKGRCDGFSTAAQDLHDSLDSTKVNSKAKKIVENP